MTSWAIAKKIERLGLFHLSSYDKGFLEATLDTDGMVGLHLDKRQFKPRVDVTNTNLSFLLRVKAICRGFGVIYQNNGGCTSDLIDREKCLALYRYCMPATLQRVILPQLKLTIKEPQRRLLIEALRLIKQRRGRGSWKKEYIRNRLKEIHDEIVKLNSRSRRTPNCS